MAKIVLDRPGVPPIVGQLVAARVTQHMAADLEREARRLSSPRNHALVTCHAQGCQALGGEHVEPRLPLPLQAAQGAEFAPTNRVDAGCPPLERRTCSLPVRKSMSSQRKATSSLARSPWR